jgi:histidine triad (HIT) family protein
MPYYRSLAVFQWRSTSMKDDCIFCKIIAGELPATKVFEDADTLAFMDIGPVVKGHTLVIPKEHYPDMASTPPDVLQKLIVVVRKIAQAHAEGLSAAGMNVTQANGKLAGQVVPHIHFHIIPRFENDTCSFNWTPHKYDSNEDMNEFAERIKKGISHT